MVWSYLATLFLGFAIALTAYTAYMGVHEGTHYYYAKKSGADVESVCLLGYWPNFEGDTEKTAMGWVVTDREWNESCNWWMFGHSKDNGGCQ